MHLVLKSALNKSEKGITLLNEGLKLLLIYQDTGFVNTAMELLRTAAGKVREDIPLFCAIWDFDVVAEPLLMKVAVHETSAADLVIVVQRKGDELPSSVREWLNLWRCAHHSGFVVRRGLRWNGQCFDYAQATADSEIEQVGELGDMNFFTAGAPQESALIAFKSELVLGLTFQIRRSADRTHLTKSKLNQNIIDKDRSELSAVSLPARSELACGSATEVKVLVD